MLNEFPAINGLAPSYLHDCLPRYSICSKLVSGELVWSKRPIPFWFRGQSLIFDTDGFCSVFSPSVDASYPHESNRWDSLFIFGTQFLFDAKNKSMGIQNLGKNSSSSSKAWVTSQHLEQCPWRRPLHSGWLVQLKGWLPLLHQILQPLFPGFPFEL